MINHNCDNYLNWLMVIDEVIFFSGVSIKEAVVLTI